MVNSNRKDNRKNEIIDAALKVFSEKDYQDATISEITKLVGISEATMYEYFGSKEDLLFAIPGKITRRPLNSSNKFFHLSGAPRARSRQSYRTI